MLKALFWKEWRESRLLLVSGLLLMASLSLLNFFPGWYFESYITFLPMLFVVLSGVTAFSKEEGKLIFLLSKPVGRQAIITIKLVNGLLNSLIILLIAMVIIWSMNFSDRVFIMMSRHILYKEVIVYYPFWLSLYYIISFFMSSLFLKGTTSVLIGLFGTAYINSGLYIFLKNWDWLYFYPIFLLAISLVFLFLSYFIFMRREVRR